MNDVVSTATGLIGWAPGLTAAFGVLPYSVGMIGYGTTSARRIQGFLLACASLLVVSGLAAGSITILIGVALLVPGLVAVLWLLRAEIKRRHAGLV
jgi:hypothetical protein